jgi:phosphopantothenoylcysteine synthetase/decarboxylase
MTARKVLVTAGSTMSMIDDVRGVTNVFRGRTGAHIAAHFAEKGNAVTLLTSNAAIVPQNLGIRVLRFRTYDDLHTLMGKEIRGKKYDLVIHSAAVSDYQVSEILGLPDDADGGIGDGVWYAIGKGGKISSSRYGKISIVMSRTEKIVDLIRDPWGFHGTLVKFKLQVGISDEELFSIARESRVASSADLIVANTLEMSWAYAYIIGESGTAQKSSRRTLPTRLLEAVERIEKGEHV